MTAPNPDRKLCGAKTRAGTPCKNSGMTNGRCRMHGGMTPRGAASPHYKTGRWSKAIGAQALARHYQEGLADQDLIALRDEIALNDAMIAELIGQLGSGESGAVWRGLRSAWAGAVAAEAEHDTKKVNEMLAIVGELAQKGAARVDVSREIDAKLDLRRRLVAQEHKRLVDAQQMVDVKQAMLLVGAVMGLLKSGLERYMPNEKTRRDTLSWIQRGVEGMTG